MQSAVGVEDEAATRPIEMPASGAAKRAVDIVLATIAIVALAGPMLLIAVAIVICDPGPVLFRQVRVGRRGRPFRITKFRTMVVDAEERLRGDPALLAATYLAGGNKLHPADDVRVTRLGRSLRATSLDELPQLFNVLAGSMSLVGPRPVLYSELRHYEAYASRWSVRGDLRLARSSRSPGVTERTER